MRIYNLKLSNNEKWSILSNNHRFSWLDDFMVSLGAELSLKMEEKKIFFLPRSKTEIENPCLLVNSIDANIPISGWKVYGYPNYFLWVQFEYPVYIFEIIREKLDSRQIRLLILDILSPIYLSIMYNAKGLPLHSSCIEYNGKALILAGDSGSGKTTCCNRIPSPWRVLTDEETVVLDEGSGRYQAHPFPNVTDFARNNLIRNYNTHRGLPISAIFFLKKDTIDAIRSISLAEAVLRINKSASEIFLAYSHLLSDRLIHNKMQFNNAVLIARKIPCFLLFFKKEGFFWRELENLFEKNLRNEDNTYPALNRYCFNKRV